MWLNLLRKAKTQKGYSAAPAADDDGDNHHHHHQKQYTVSKIYLGVHDH
jgi:hypothetical protein